MNMQSLSHVRASEIGYAIANKLSKVRHQRGRMNALAVESGPAQIHSYRALGSWETCSRVYSGHIRAKATAACALPVGDGLAGPFRSWGRLT